MAGCAGQASIPTGLHPQKVDTLASEIHKCVLKDQLVKAKFILKGLPKEDKRRIVSKKFDENAALFLAAKQGQVHFVNYLLDDCGAGIEQLGVYEVQEDRSRHHVSSLWCATVTNKFEVVKSLIKHGANVNAASDTQSTPVRSACYMTNLEIVKYLVDNGADIHKPNINGGTCLINSVQSVDLCRYLIEKQADVNAQDNSGNLALHYAIREGRMETVKLLLKQNADPYMKNDQNDDAIHTASLRGHQDILEYLVMRIKPPLYRQIEGFELIGTNFVDEKHEILKAIQIWKHAMDLKCNDPENVHEKMVATTRQAAYQYAVEAKNMKELEEKIKNPDEIYMQSLLIRERILGPDHKDTIFGLMYRGAVYADMHRYQRCVDLWKYAFQLRHEKNEPLNHECLFTLQALCKLFWEIYEEHDAGYTNENVQYSDLMEVLEMAAKEVEAGKDVIHLRPVFLLQQEEFEVLLLLLLHLIHLLQQIRKTEEETVAFKQQVYRIIRINACDMNGKTLLHLAVDRKASVVTEEFYSKFPDRNVIELLLDCQAPVNSFDDNRNTPLHVCAERMISFNDQVDMRLMSSIVDLLISRGAHLDACNAKGKIPAVELTRRSWYKLCAMEHITLKCLCSRIIKKCNVEYKGEVPVSLEPFIAMH